MANPKKRVQPIVLKIGLSLLTVILVGAIVFTTYYFTINKADSGYIDELYAQSIQVNKYNEVVSDLTAKISNLSLKDTKKLSEIRSGIADASYGMGKVIQDLQKIKAPAKYKQQFDSYSKGIYANRKIFTQTNFILKNTRSSKLSDQINELGKFIAEASKRYEESKLKKASIKLPEGILGMTDRIGEYALKSFNDYENKSRDLENYLSYYKLMDNVKTEFNDSKINLGVFYNMLKSEETTFDEVYAKIEAKLSELAQIQSNYEAISIPSNSKIKETHLLFNDLVKRYTYYCQDFKIAVSRYEEASNDEAAQADAAFTFDDLEIKYKTLSKAYTDYNSSYNADKTKFSNIENL